MFTIPVNNNILVPYIPQSEDQRKSISAKSAFNFGLKNAEVKINRYYQRMNQTI